jgi:hypothetical protein
MEDDSAPLAWLEERIAAATLLPSSHGEAFNVLHYENDQHYDSHMDTFDPKVQKKPKHKLLPAPRLQQLGLPVTHRRL